MNKKFYQFELIFSNRQKFLSWVFLIFRNPREFTEFYITKIINKI